MEFDTKQHDDGDSRTKSIAANEASAGLQRLMSHYQYLKINYALSSSVSLQNYAAVPVGKLSTVGRKKIEQHAYFFSERVC